MSWPVSRILFLTVAVRGGEAATIHLGHPSPGASSGLPADIGRATLERLRDRTEVRSSWPCFGWGLP